MRRYSSVLETEDATMLLSLTGPQRRHAMEALTILSKIIGCYDKWQQIRRNYSLHWTNGNESLQALHRFFDTDLTLESMLQRVKEMMRALPVSMALVIRHALLTGLRPSEACQSVRLLNVSSGSRQCFTAADYYNPEQQCLQHYKFPDIFLRATKKAYLSYITLDNLQPIANLGTKTPSLAAISSACKRRNVQISMNLTRKIFASYLRQRGIEPEIVDLLQGRVSQSVLTRHYLSPPQHLKKKVLQAVDELRGEIESKTSA